MSESWRAFVGEWNGGAPERTQADMRNLPWDQAQKVLLDFANTFDPGECEFCAATRANAITQLEALDQGNAWTGDIDWDDLVLVPDAPN